MKSEMERKMRIKREMKEENEKQLQVKTNQRKKQQESENVKFFYFKNLLNSEIKLLIT